MKTVLITGRMGVGKSELVSFLKKRDYPVFLADESAKKQLKPDSSCYFKLKKLFPDPDLYQQDRQFDKKKLAHCMFKNPDKKKAVEQIIHPKVRELFKKFVEKESQKQNIYVFYEAPFISKEILKTCDLSVLITSSYEKQMERLLKLGWNEKEIKERLESQVQEKDIIEEVDFIIENKKDKESLEKQLDLFLKKLKKLSA